VGFFASLFSFFSGRPPSSQAPGSWTRSPAPAAGKVPSRPTPPPLNLDAGAFAPLSDEEVRRRAKDLRWNWQTVNFDSRNHIPSAHEPRTALIDQAMVAHGLLTPEQLLAIHEVGARMADLRPGFGNLHQAGIVAVAADAAERARRKAERKAASEKRRKEHAEAVAQRRATDIVFLGRGVSGGLADRRADVERLQAAGLPVLASPADLAAALRLPIPRLRWLAFHTEASAISHYVRFRIPKKSGGTRELAAPHRDMAACQRWILSEILAKVPLNEAAHGFVSGRSTVSNAQPHLGRAVVVNADLKDFFPSITFPRVKGVFQQLGYSPAVATVLGLLCTECPRATVLHEGRKLHVATGPRALPQGACTSPALSNLVARGLDARIAGIARRIGWTYTRYADDLSFSTDTPGASRTGWLLARLRHVVGEENFTVNEDKTRIQRPNTRQSVTGIVVNQRANVPRDTVRRLRAILHKARTEGLAAQNREGHPHFVGWVEGMIAYIAMVNPERGRALRAQLEQVRRR